MMLRIAIVCLSIGFLGWSLCKAAARKMTGLEKDFDERGSYE